MFGSLRLATGSFTSSPHHIFVLLSTYSLYSAWRRSMPNCTGVTPSARNNHATFTVGTRLYVHGGHDGSKWLADLHCLDTEKMEWSVPSPGGVCPSARACHTTTTLGRKVTQPIIGVASCLLLFTT
jgi:hypothetical protein